MKDRRRDAKLCAAALGKHNAQRLSYIKKVRLARHAIKTKMAAAELPMPSRRKLKVMVARVLSATGDPKPRQGRMSLGQGLQQIQDRMRKEHDAKQAASS